MNPDTTLNELLGPAWSDPPFDSPMVKRIRALGQIPLREFMAEDYRLIISQQRALDILVPLAIPLVEEDPFTEGDFGTGDLLLAIGKVSSDYWLANPSLRARLKSVLAKALARMGELDEVDRSSLEPGVRNAYQRL